MIERYTRPEMGAIWSDERKIDALAGGREGGLRSLEPARPDSRRGDARDPCGDVRSGADAGDRARSRSRVIAFLRATGETVGD